MIEIEDVGVVRHGRNVVSGCDAILPTGTVTMLAGAGDAASRALVRAIAGVERFSGSIRFDGRPNRDVRSALYVSFRDARVLPQLDGFDTVRLLSGRSASNLEIAGLAPGLADRALLRAKASSLTAGARKRLHVIAALAARAKYVLLEDVTGGADAPTLDEVAAAIEQRIPDATVLVTGGAEEFPTASEARVRLLQTQEPIIT